MTCIRSGDGGGVRLCHPGGGCRGGGRVSVAIVFGVCDHVMQLQRLVEVCAGVLHLVWVDKEHPVHVDRDNVGKQQFWDGGIVRGRCVPGIAIDVVVVAVTSVAVTLFVVTIVVAVLGKGGVRCAGGGDVVTVGFGVSVVVIVVGHVYVAIDGVQERQEFLAERKEGMEADAQ